MRHGRGYQLTLQDRFKLDLISLDGSVTNDILLRTTFGWTPSSTLPTTAFGTPGLTLSTTNAAGSATTAVRTDATIALFDATVPADVSGAAAATGSAAIAARRDHVHDLATTISDAHTFSGIVTLSAAGNVLPDANPFNFTVSAPNTIFFRVTAQTVGGSSLYIPDLAGVDNDLVDRKSVV